MATLYEYNHSSNLNIFSSAATRWQTFTPAINHTVRMVRLMCSRISETHLVEILATSGGSPTGSALASGTMPITTLTSGWRYTGLGAGVALLAGIQYAIRVYTNTPPGSMGFIASNANPYAGGRFVFAANYDIQFEEWDASFPNLPVLISPANGATKVSLTPTLTATYGHCEGTAQAGAQWQIDEYEGDFSVPVWDSGDDAVNLLSITLLKVNKLNPNTQYIWRVRHKDSASEWSEWPTAWSFTTRSNAYSQAHIIG